MGNEIELGKSRVENSGRINSGWKLSMEIVESYISFNTLDVPILKLFYKFDFFYKLIRDIKILCIVEIAWSSVEQEYK